MSRMGIPPEMAARCLIVLVLASTITTSIGQATAAAAAGATLTPAQAFLRERCNAVTYKDPCYNDLAPYADSFGGSRTKVAVASATILMAKLDAFDKELQGVNVKFPGKYQVDVCKKMVKDATEGQRERLARFKALEAIDDAKVTANDIAELRKWATDTWMGYNKCDEDTETMPDVNEVLPSYEPLGVVMLNCVNLIVGIKA
ncbi:hypothetical protein ACP70R_020667 [Stipagrostis hirtigluma subsp. patula]